MFPNRTEKRATGDLGESIASKFLVKRGFEIIERNYLRKCGEIDIVARNKGVLRFIEVKTTSVDLSSLIPHKTEGYRAEENVHEKKLQRMRRVIQVYLNDKNVSEQGKWFFDVVTVLLDRKNKLAKVNILENIVL